MVKCDLHIGKQFNFLKSMTTSEKQALRKNSATLYIKKGEVIFFEDEQLQTLYCITEGICKFSLIDDKGKEHITNLLGKGELMGRRSIITKKGALVTATAITDVSLCLLDKDTILNSIAKNNAFCQDVLKGFIGDVETETEKIAYFQNHRTVKLRLAGLLLYLSKKFGVEKQGWLRAPLRRQDIANILGTTSEYVISLLASFKEKKYLSLNREKIKINSDKVLLDYINTH